MLLLLLLLLLLVTMMVGMASLHHWSCRSWCL
jgi:hypothetical protein